MIDYTCCFIISALNILNHHLVKNQFEQQLFEYFVCLLL